MRRTIAPSADALRRRCATARTRTRRAAFYRTPDQRAGVSTARQLQGKELSYNNINDTDAAYECVAEFDATRTAACAIIKHANPCGVAEGADLAERLSQGAGLRLRLRPLAASSPSTARSMPMRPKPSPSIFTEVIIAPDATEEAIAIIGKRKRTCGCCLPAACPIRARAA